MRWTLVVPAGVNELMQEVASYFNVGVDELLSEPGFPIIISGTKTQSAVVSVEPGSEGLELDIADFLSARIKGPFFFIFDSEDRHGVYLHQAGDEPLRRPDSIDDFAASVGLDLSAFFRASPAPYKSVVKTICVLDGPSASSVRQALGVDEATRGVYVQELENGSVFYHSDHGNIAVSVYNLMTVFPGPIYFIHRDMETEYFSCTVLQDGKEAGIFEYPEYLTEDIPELRGVLGSSTPQEILKSLGVPPGLLGLEM